LAGSYAVYSRTFWLGEVSAQGYSIEDFREVFKRYIPRSELEVLRGESRPPETEKKPDDSEGTHGGASAAAA